MQPKQKPFFSTLDEAALDLSDLETAIGVTAPGPTLPEPFAVPIGLPQQTSATGGGVPSATPEPVPAVTAAAGTGLEEKPAAVPVAGMSGAPDEAMPSPAAETGSPEALVREQVPEIEPVLVQAAQATAQNAGTAVKKGAVREAASSRMVSSSIETTLFVPIEAGRFLMGSPQDEPGRGHDEALHEVTLTRRFLMQAAPVTQRQWLAVMEGNPSRFAIGGEDCPVEGVSWNDCQEFIRRLNKNGGAVYRLPTEAEWEYACRAGTGTAFYSGPITKKILWRNDSHLDEIGWYGGNSGKKTHPVAQKRANAWGLYDMTGNVCEWCQDWYGKYAGKPQTDPKGPTFGSGCVVRGGSWQSETRACRSASRLHFPPGFRCDHVGFRLVRGL